MPAKGWIRPPYKVCSQEEAIETILFVIERIMSTPSLEDKLPTYLYERVYAVAMYLKENGGMAAYETGILRGF